MKIHINKPLFAWDCLEASPTLAVLQEFLELLPDADGNENIVYDQEGTLYCYDKVSDPPVRHKMAYFGYEKDRDTLKYRCPARQPVRRTSDAMEATSMARPSGWPTRSR